MSQERTLEEIQDMVVNFATTTHVEDRSRKSLYIMQQLDLGNINPNNLLSCSIDRIQVSMRGRTLPLIGLALRFGANPNVYLNSEFGSCHVLVYIVNSLRKKEIDRSFILTVVEILLRAESDLDKPSFDELGGLSKSYDKAVVSEFTRPPLTVREWMKSKQLNHDTAFINTHPDIKSYIGAILDREDLAYFNLDGTKFYPKIEDLLLCRSNTVASVYSFPVSSAVTVSGEKDLMIRAIECRFSSCFERLIQQGLRPTYFGINRIALGISDPLSSSSEKAELMSMMLKSISVGVRIDIHQESLLKEYATSIAQEYAVPEWRKLCNDPKPSKELSRIGLNIGLTIIDPTKLCSDLNKISDGDYRMFAQHSIERQTVRIASTCRSFLDYSDTATSCHGSSITPYEHSDVHTAFYSDIENIWCYNSSEFENLIITELNPVNKAFLSESFKSELKAKMKIIREHDIDISRAPKVLDSIENLEEKDEITSSDTDFAIRTVEQVMGAKGVSLARLRSFDTEEMNAILGRYGMRQENLGDLTPTHRFATFCRAFYYVLKTNTNAASHVFERLN